MVFAYRAFTVCGWLFHAIRLTKSFVTPWVIYGRPRSSHDTDAATTVILTLHRFRLFPVRSPLLGESSFLYFPAGNEMFQFPAFPTLSRFQEMSPGWLPNLGNPRITACLTASRGLSQLCHVLLRLWTPRHPPCTLRSLTTLVRNVFAVHTTCVPNPLRFQRARLEQRSCRCAFPSSPSSSCVDCDADDSTPSAELPNRLDRVALERTSSRLCSLMGVLADEDAGASPGWRRPDSNRRPPGCKPGALPAELRPRPAISRRRTVSSGRAEDDELVGSEPAHRSDLRKLSRGSNPE